MQKNSSPPTHTHTFTHTHTHTPCHRKDYQQEEVEGAEEEELVEEAQIRESEKVEQI